MVTVRWGGVISRHTGLPDNLFSSNNWISGLGADNALYIECHNVILLFFLLSSITVLFHQVWQHKGIFYFVFFYFAGAL